VSPRDAHGHEIAAEPGGAAPAHRARLHVVSGELGVVEQPEPGGGGPAPAP
jgi:hypothetical protein